MPNSSDFADAASKLKTVKNVFKRKSKNDMSASAAEDESSRGNSEDNGYNSDTET